MAGQSSPAEVYLESDRVRVVNDLNVVASDVRSPVVSLHPDTATVTVGSDAATSGGKIDVQDSTGTSLGVLSAAGGAGSLEVRNGAGDTVVSLAGDSATQRKIEVTKPGQGVQTSVETRTPGGRITVYHNRNQDPVVVGEAGPDGGRLELATSDGETTCELDADDAALVLSGTSEQDASDTRNEDWGGGEVVVSSYAAPGTKADVAVHLRGERGSDYGVDDNNRPRINVDGPNATLELGRESLGSDRGGVAGEVVVRADTGDPVLTVRVDDSINPGATSGGEVEFTWVDGQGTARQRGTIQAHPDGLMVYDAGGNEALLVGKRGTIRTRKPIQQTL